MGSGSIRLGFMAAFAVSGSIVLIARQIHKRLLSDFMKKIEFELNGSKQASTPCQQKMKKVRFADDVMEPSSNNEEYRRRHLLRIMSKGDGNEIKLEEDHDDVTISTEPMQLNRKVLYKGLLEQKSLRVCNMQ